MVPNKKIIVSILVLIAVVLTVILLNNSSKVDDWKYSHTSPDQLFINIGIALGVALLLYIIYAIYLIISGKRTEERMNPKRNIGIFLLVGPIAVIGASIFGLWIASITSRYIDSWGLLLIPIIAITYLIIVIRKSIYAWKKHVRWSLIPIIGSMIIILIMPAATELISSTNYYAISIPQVGMMEASAGRDTLGFAVGGAKDIDNFRQNIENNYLPIPTDITYEGLFYDYFFDTASVTECTQLFCPSYSSALSTDPFSEEQEYYLQVGLNSNIAAEDFARKDLNLVVVLDISGSMRSSFNTYYYDQFRESESEDPDAGKSKMEIATKAITQMLDHLGPNDKFGMVLFDSSDFIGKPLSEVSKTDMNAIKGHILDLQPRGGTNFEAGYKGGTSLFRELSGTEIENAENRIIFLTDAMANMGSLSEDSLLGLTKANAEEKIHTTFIGIGVDFQTQLIEEITKVKGANYYSVHSSEEFKKRLDTEFSYMVTPLVFNLQLQFESDGFEIEKVYGSPESEEATGEIMKVNTLFPSPTVDGETKGGIVILKLNKTGDNNEIRLKTSYETRDGVMEENTKKFIFTNTNADYYGNTGIQKGILLSRYVNIMRDWIEVERKNVPPPSGSYVVYYEENGIPIAKETDIEFSRWERQSARLAVSEDYETIISDFSDYFEQQSAIIGDSTLAQEATLMEQILS